MPAVSLLLLIAAVSAVVGDVPYTTFAPDGQGPMFLYQGGDEFACTSLGTAIPNTSIWNYDIGYIANNEKQYYTANPANAYISSDSEGVVSCQRTGDDGFLQIVAKSDVGYDGTVFNYTSSRLKSDGLFCVEQGSLIQVRARVPKGRGTWPAIWLLGPDTEGWPATGEIDMMEAVGYIPNRTFTTIHGSDLTVSGATEIGGNSSDDTLYSQFHVFSSVWNSSGIYFFTDNHSTFSIPKTEIVRWTPWESRRCFYVILNLAIGGDWGGVDGIDDKIFPVSFPIDYVRIYSSNMSHSDSFWTPTGPNAPDLTFGLGRCDGTSVPSQWSAASLDYIRFPRFSSFATGKVAIPLIGDETCTLGANGGPIFVGGVNGGYLYKMPGGNGYDVRRSSAGLLQVSNGQTIYSAAELDEYSGGTKATSVSCCVYVSSPSTVATPAPTPSSTPVQAPSSNGMSTGTKAAIGVVVAAIVVVIGFVAIKRFRGTPSSEYGRLEMSNSPSTMQQEHDV